MYYICTCTECDFRYHSGKTCETSPANTYGREAVSLFYNVIPVVLHLATIGVSYINKTISMYYICMCTECDFRSHSGKTCETSPLIAYLRNPLLFSFLILLKVPSWIAIVPSNNPHTDFILKCYQILLLFSNTNCDYALYHTINILTKYINFCSWSILVPKLFCIVYVKIFSIHSGPNMHSSNVSYYCDSILQYCPTHKPFSCTQCDFVSDKIMDLPLSGVKTAPSYQHLLPFISCKQMFSVYVLSICLISRLTYLYYIFGCTECDYKSGPFIHFQSSSEITFWRYWVQQYLQPYLNTYVPLYCSHTGFISKYYPLPRLCIVTIFDFLSDRIIIMNCLNTWKSNTRTLLTKVPFFSISVVYYCTFCKHILMSEIMSYPCFIYCYSLIIFCAVFTFNSFYQKPFLECWSNEIVRYLLNYIINKLFNISLIYFSNVAS